MKRLSSSDSLQGALMSVCPTSEEHSPRNNHVYGRDFRSMLDGLDEEGCVEESGHVSEKKRRLSVEQVKALEKNFEVENKLEPERKVKLAQELGLQPRQVAVWFQNRRARWKTKQLERDYGLLKANYDSLKLNYDTLQRDNESLLKEIRELKSKFQEENTESNLSVKEELIAPADSDQKQAVINPDNNHNHNNTTPNLQSKEMNFEHQESFNNNNNNVVSTTNDTSNNMFEVSNMFQLDFKDGSSDSDSSAILNEENIANNNNSRGVNSLQTHQLMNMSSSSSPSSSSMNCFGSFQKTTSYQPQFVKIEEHNFFSGEETCNFFSDEQPPTLHWYCSGEDQWN
ncbi:hypothetical protein TIFTF001_004399 [Ficus carica]|uniref:Homeobox-leucine zipper protein n=1 Tax=Ficus carica TaxID=3494 RepID=A0AA87ZKQ1_FICCA|nr:hypothetical protein TIFTF001_004399 [Ficus carica]